MVGEAYYRFPDPEKAAAQYERALELYQATLGDQEATWQTMNDVGEVYKKLYRFDRAEELLKAALAAKRAKWGNDNRSTQRSVNNLAGVYRELERFDEAEPLMREAYEARRRLLGPDDSDTLNATNNLAALYMRMGQPKEAEPLFREAAEGYERVHGIRFETALYRSNVGDCLLEQQRYAEAVPEYLKALDYLRRITPEEGKNLRPHIRRQMAKLYTEWGKPEEAAKWAPEGEAKKP
jgi:tetratricopeptide (TPR) repeat protein